MLLGIVLMVVGILTLVRKELKLSDSRISRGAPARTAGIVLILALPVTYLVQIGLGLAERSGSPLVGEATRGTLSYAVLVVMAAAALAIAWRGTHNPA
jgi:hypothetical protein